MHIVFVTVELATDNNSSGGLASFTANMARIFAQHGHKVSIILASTKEENLIFDSEIDLYTSYVEMRKWKKFDIIARVISNLCKESQDEIRRTLINIYKSNQVEKTINEINNIEKIDIVHYCNHGSLNLKADKKIPYVVRISGFLNIWTGGAETINGSVAYEDNPLSVRNKLEEYTIKKAKYVIVPSNILADICIKNLNVKPTVLESPFVLDKGDWDYGVYKSICDRKKYIIHYGTQSYLKGTYVVGQLVYNLLKKHGDVYLVLIGREKAIGTEKLPAKEYVKLQAKEFGDRVICIEKLPREQLYPFISNAELCLLPSRIDNLPNACIEAMAMGKIVVATNGASYEQLIEDGVSGFLCERDNPDSFLNGIDRALGMSENERIKMSQKAVEVTKRLSPDNIYEKYLECYQKVISEWGK